MNTNYGRQLGMVIHKILFQAVLMDTMCSSSHLQWGVSLVAEEKICRWDWNHINAPFLLCNIQLSGENFKESFMRLMTHIGIRKDTELVFDKSITDLAFYST